MGDWLGTGRISYQKIKWRSFKDARIFAHSLGLKSGRYWREYYKSEKKPDDIPTNPEQVYKKEWKSMGDWLGTGRIASQLKQFRSISLARKYVRSLRLQNQKQWREFAKSGKLPKDIPSDPGNHYKKEFKGYGDWLGTR